MQPIAQALADRTLANPIVTRNLAVFPLLNSPPPRLNYLTLSEALSSDLAVVQEVSESGVVAELRFRNRSPRPILILDGQELVGAKQNRTVNITILAPPESTLSIPVTCIEAGRWSYTKSDFDFDVAERAHFARGRAQKMASVSRSMAECESRQADQSEVWDTIAAKSERMNVHSATAALSDVFDGHGTSIEDYVSGHDTVQDQTGAVFAIDGRVEGLELFDSTATCEKLFPTLVRSYALDALETADRPAPVPSKTQVETFIKRLADGKGRHYDAIGLGREIRIEAAEVVAGGLMVDDILVHLAAFTRQTQNGSSGSHGRDILSARVRQARTRHRA